MAWARADLIKIRRFTVETRAKSVYKYGCLRPYIRMEIRGMLNRVRVILGAGLVCLLATAGINLAQKPATPTAPPVKPAAKPAAAAPAGLTVESQQALVKQYCSGCH